jgi:hypothetical protein
VRAHHHPPGARLSIPTVHDPVWSLAQPRRHWPLRVRILARLQAPWLDLALASGADPAGSPQLERRAAHLLSHLHRVRVAEGQLVELEELLIGTTPVYCRGVAMASEIVSEAP